MENKSLTKADNTQTKIENTSIKEIETNKTNELVDKIMSKILQIK
jgi:hypothetical protein